MDSMYVRRESPVLSPRTLRSWSQLEDEESNVIRRVVGQCAFQKLLKMSVKNKNGVPRIRSFGELSEIGTEWDLRKMHDREVTGVSVCRGVSDTQSDSEEGQEMGKTAIRLNEGNTIEMMMLSLWEMCREKGLFRYDVRSCSTKTVPGAYGFVAQLNEGRGNKKRPTEFRVDKVVQEFDETKFNFTKALMKEVLFRFDTDAADDVFIDPSASAGRNPDLVMINVSPIEYGHILLVPHVLERIPQIVDVRAMLLALQFTSAIGNPYFRLGYNSLGAYATINHLHFQGYYLQAPYPVERAQCKRLEHIESDGRFVRVERLVGFPVRGWVFEMAASFSASLQPLAIQVADVCAKLQNMNIPHNLLISDCGARVFVWPQCYAEKQAKGLVAEKLLATGVNPAAFEIAGHVIFKNRQDYEEINQSGVWELLSEVSLTEERFVALTRCL